MSSSGLGRSALPFSRIDFSASQINTGIFVNQAGTVNLGTPAPNSGTLLVFLGGTSMVDGEPVTEKRAGLLLPPRKKRPEGALHPPAVE